MVLSHEGTHSQKWDPFSHSYFPGSWESNGSFEAWRNRIQIKAKVPGKTWVTALIPCI